MSELQPRYCAFGSNGFRNVGKARDHPIVVRAELGVESTTPAIVGERDFYDHKSCTARCAGSVVFNILPCRAAVRCGIHGAHRRLNHAISKTHAANLHVAAESRKARRPCRSMDRMFGSRHSVYSKLGGMLQHVERGAGEFEQGVATGVRETS
jgi:hypothetical protein